MAGLSRSPTCEVKALQTIRIQFQGLKLLLSYDIKPLPHAGHGDVSFHYMRTTFCGRMTRNFSDN